MCLEMKGHSNNQIYGIVSPSYGLSSTVTLPIETPLLRQNSTIYTSNNNSFNSNNNNHHNNNNNNNHHNNSSANNYLSSSNNGINLNINNNNNNSCNADLASVDSSDTYASCQTHPFLSQGDLTADLADATGACELDDIDLNNLYINPLEKESSIIISQVKKSASGDTALRNLGGGGAGCDSPSDEQFQPFQSSFDSRERSGSRVSLNESPIPKHRKTRFQNFASKPTSKTRFDIVSTKASEESLNDSVGKKTRKSSFMPSKSLASATKLINQHLFGIQNVNSKGN